MEMYHLTHEMFTSPHPTHCGVKEKCFKPFVIKMKHNPNWLNTRNLWIIVTPVSIPISYLQIHCTFGIFSTWNLSAVSTSVPMWFILS